MKSEQLKEKKEERKEIATRSSWKEEYRRNLSR
jgi:hypothetical protein